ncbi:MAG: hypothetical protein R3F61_17395 [Myxococcota bacterium]
MTWLDDEASELHPDIAVEVGLGALTATLRRKLTFDDTRRIAGSVDVDTCLRASFPNEPRWDFVVGYGEHAWFIEEHPANSGTNFDEMIAKAQWLRALVRGKRIAARSRGLHWVSTGATVSQLGFSRKRRLLAELGVRGPSRTLTVG